MLMLIPNIPPVAFKWCPWKDFWHVPFLNLHGRHVPSFVSGRGATIFGVWKLLTWFPSVFQDGSAPDLLENPWKTEFHGQI